LNVIDKELPLAGLLMVTDRIAEAESLILAAKTAVIDRQAAKPSLRERNLIAAIWSHLAQIHGIQKRMKEAESEYHASGVVYEALAADFPKNPLYHFQLARTWFYAGNIARSDNRPEDARSNYIKSLDIMKRLARDYSANTQFQEMLKVVNDALKTLPPPPGKKP
jgi:hypothetical protein